MGLVHARVIIIVNEDGEAVAKRPMSRPDDPSLENLMHHVCKGGIARQDVSDTKQALYCAECGLRVVFPRSVQNLSQLREYFSRFIPATES